MMGIKQKEETAAAGLHNTLAVGTTVKGNIVTEIDFRLDGVIEGDVVCNGKMVIGPKAHVIGNIISDNAEILGKVEGSIRVKAKLSLKGTATIKGDIFAQTLEIEPNARFNGICSMTSEKETTTAKK
ncbi:MAG: polymer-forming cytoskeletal protein [Tannerellaceae bacterium]